MHKPSDETEFVRSEFLRCHKQLIGHGSVELAKQYRKKLKKPELDEFKKEITGLELIDGKRGNAFQFHLWSLALHATKSNFKTKIRKLKKALTQTQQQGVQKDKRKPRAA